MGNIRYLVKMLRDATQQQFHDGSLFTMNKMVSAFIFFKFPNNTKSCYSRLNRKTTVYEI